MRCLQKPDTELVTAATSRLQNFVMINYHSKVFHPGRVSSPRFAFETQPLSFCILCCITNFAIAPCTVPVFFIISSDSRFSEGFLWYGKLFLTLGPKTLNLCLQRYLGYALVYSNSTNTFLGQAY